MDPEIHKLTSAVASGDTEAFAHLYNDWFDRMYAEAQRTSGRDEDFCLDIVQDAMMRVIKSLKPLETEAALRKWLRLTVQSCAYDRFRSEARRRRREEAVASSPVEADDDDLDERLAWLKSELEKTDEKSRSLLIMRHRFGWTLAQIGSVLGMKTGAVDGRIRRILAAMRQRAQETFDD